METFLAMLVRTHFHLDATARGIQRLLELIQISRKTGIQRDLDLLEAFDQCALQPTLRRGNCEPRPLARIKVVMDLNPEPGGQRKISLVALALCHDVADPPAGRRHRNDEDVDVITARVGMTKRDPLYGIHRIAQLF